MLIVIGSMELDFFTLACTTHSLGVDVVAGQRVLRANREHRMHAVSTGMHAHMRMHMDCCM